MHEATFCPRSKGQQGAALPLVLVSLLFLTLLGFLAMTTSAVEVRLAANERDYQQAIYVAEAGVAHARALVEGLLNVCNQTKIAAGIEADWDFVLQDLADCPALAGQTRPLSITAALDNFRYTVTLVNNPDEVDTAATATNDVDKKIVVISRATGPTGVRAGVEVVLSAENAESDVGGYSGQYGAGAGKNFTGRDSRAITNTASTSLGSL